jgi:1-phosphofructokinase
MIVTLTPNPSVDRTIEVDALHRGAVLRARATRVDPGGKGVNVSRALAANHRETTAVLPAGGWEGEQLAALLAPLEVPVVVVPVAGSVRANVSVVEPDGTVTKLNEPGPRLSPEEIEAVTAATVKAAAAAEWLACTGSLPPGAPIDFYAQVLERLGSASVKVAVDSSGAPLVAALDARPDLIKPNREELAEATGRQLLTLGDVVDAAQELRGRGVGAVLASLGADGAVLVDATGATFGSATVERPRSAVGAGDSMLAGFLAGGGSGPDALAEALAWGAAAASLPGSIMPTPDDLDHGAVTLADRIDPDRPLKERS